MKEKLNGDGSNELSPIIQILTYRSFFVSMFSESYLEYLVHCKNINQKKGKKKNPMCMTMCMTNYV